MPMLSPGSERARQSIRFYEAVALHDVAYIAETLGVEERAISFVDADGNPVAEGGDLCLTQRTTVLCKDRRRNFVMRKEAPDAHDAD